jgi:hypothetical protein
MTRRAMISFVLVTLFGASSLGYRRWLQNQAMSMGGVIIDPSDVGAASATATATTTAALAKSFQSLSIHRLNPAPRHRGKSRPSCLRSPGTKPPVARSRTP